MEKFIQQNKIALIGAIIGLLLATLLLTIGFFKTILILILGSTGFYIGYYLQKNNFFSK